MITPLLNCLVRLSIYQREDLTNPESFVLFFVWGFIGKIIVIFFSLIKIMFSIDNLTIESAFFIL